MVVALEGPSSMTCPTTDFCFKDEKKISVEKNIQAKDISNERNFELARSDQ